MFCLKKSIIKISRYLVTGIFLFTLSQVCYGVNFDKASSKAKYVPNEILIKLAPSIKMGGKSVTLASSSHSLNSFNVKQGVKKIEPVFKRRYKVNPKVLARNKKKSQSMPDLSKWYKITFGSQVDIPKQVAAYKLQSEISWAEPNYYVYPCSVPNDPYYSSKGSWGQDYDDLWGLKKIQMEKAWDISKGSHEIVVAVIDSGIDYTHPDIVDNLWQNPVDGSYGWDFSGNDNDPIDDEGHGTHVAGTIGAVGNNGIGVVGVNWQVKIMSLRVFGNKKSSSTSELSDAIRMAADQGAKVINMSLGLPSTSPKFIKSTHEAIKYAHNLGCTMVAAAGNDSADISLYFPAGISEVITVASSDEHDKRSEFSNYGSGIDIAAPGGSAIKEHIGRNILSLRAGNIDTYKYGKYIVDEKYYRTRGTSMSAPHVSGLAALLLSKNPKLSNEDIRNIIKATADDIEEIGWDKYTGAGRINAYKALSCEGVPVRAEISNIKEGEFFAAQEIDIEGTAKGDDFYKYEIIVEDKLSGNKQTVLTSHTMVEKGSLGKVDLASIANSSICTIKLVVYSKKGLHLEEQVNINVGKEFLPGWPQAGEAEMIPFGPRTYADLDGDGKKEIIAALDSYQEFTGNDKFINYIVHIFKHDGQNYNAHWPQKITHEIGNIPGYSYADKVNNAIASPAVGDLDGDGDLELVYAVGNKVHVFDPNNGEIKNNNWPYEFSDGVVRALALAKTDNSNKDRIVLGVSCLDRYMLRVLDEQGVSIKAWEYQEK